MFVGSFLGLLNPYSIMVGLLSLALFVMHGSIYMTMKTDGELQLRMKDFGSAAWIAFVILYVATTVYTFFQASYLFEGLLGNPLFWVMLVVLLGAVVYTPVALNGRKYFQAFVSSSLTTACMIGFAAVSMFPRIVPSSINLAYSLTIYNASSTARTQTVMLIIALIGMPIVIGYTVYIYRVFKGKTVLAEGHY
jgi:cytochrome d ubiquinol oxidase subunit II